MRFGLRRHGLTLAGNEHQGGHNRDGKQRCDHSQRSGLAQPLVSTRGM
jgi:hypothetical protein